MLSKTCIIRVTLRGQRNKEITLKSMLFFHLLNEMETNKFSCLDALVSRHAATCFLAQKTAINPQIVATVGQLCSSARETKTNERSLSAACDGKDQLANRWYLMYTNKRNNYYSLYLLKIMII